MIVCGVNHQADIGFDRAAAINAHGSGGPVEPDIGLVIHTADYHSPQTIGINRNIALTSSRTAIMSNMGSDQRDRIRA